jgi:hypothetical protein
VQLKKGKMIFYHQHKISDRYNTIMPIIPQIRILAIWPVYGRGPLPSLKIEIFGFFIIFRA